MKWLLRRIISPIIKRANSYYVRKPRKYRYKDISVMVYPTVFPPFFTISTKILLDFIEPIDLNSKTFLELGCGCGIISILAAKKGAIVTSTDINEVALNALKLNAEKNKVTVEILFSDLFDEMPERNFDYIIINPPYYPQSPSSIAEKAWFCGSNFEYFSKLFNHLNKILNNNNVVFMILSENCKTMEIKKIAAINGLKLYLKYNVTVAGEENFIFNISKKHT